MDRKIYQAEEKSEAKRIKELEAMKDKKRQPEEKHQVGSLTQKVTTCVFGWIPFGPELGMLWRISSGVASHCFWHFHL